MKILHLEDDLSDSIFIERGVQRAGIDATFIPARSRDEFITALDSGDFDVVLVDNALPGFNAREAIALCKSAHPQVPVIVCSGAARDADVTASFAAGASDYVLKDYLWQLAAALRRVPSAQTQPATIDRGPMLLLVDAVQQLSLARTLEDIVEIVRHAARRLVGADGATFVLRDDDCCYYVDEDAIAPLWKGQRFPLDSCISGWAMLTGKSAILPDIYQDARIPHEAYRPTFVHSLAMVPIRSAAPMGAIGTYWATRHECTPEELLLLEALANTTAVAMENVNVYQNLERQVRERTRELQSANQDLEAFSSAVAHDLRAPLRHINAELYPALEHKASLSITSIERIRDASTRMGHLIDDLLRLSRVSRQALQPQRVDLGRLAHAIIARLRAAEPTRELELRIDPHMIVNADPGLIAVALENLLSNAWKYSSKRELSRIEFSVSTNDEGVKVYCIADNGVGFDPQHTSLLFKPFTRLHDARDFPGIGIGLATVQRVIQRHGGEIWAQSDGRTGAKFFFTIQNIR